MMLKHTDSAGFEKSDSRQTETISAWITIGLMYLMLVVSLCLIWQKAN